MGDEKTSLAIIALAEVPPEFEGDPERELAAFREVYKQIGELDEDFLISSGLLVLLISEVERRALAVSMPDSSMMAMAGLGGMGML